MYQTVICGLVGCPFSALDLGGLAEEVINLVAP
jgi:hypothetical protein